MKYLTIIAVICLSLGVALADPVIVELPGLTGGYEWDPNGEPNFGYPGLRSTSFSIPLTVTHIEQIDLVISGNWSAGVMSCYGVHGPEESPIEPQLYITIPVPQTTNGYFIGSLPQGGLADGPFDELRVTLESQYPPGAHQPDELLGHPLEASFAIDFAMILICWLVEDTHGTITNVHLELFEEAVAIEEVTWSRVKGLYR